MSDEEINREDQNEDANRINLGDVLFVQSRIPDMMASRTIRAFIIEEILSALFRAGLMTKEQLGDALARGEKDVQKTCQKVLKIDDGKRPGDATEAANQMAESAAEVCKYWRDKFIDGKPEEPEE